ncbi:Na+/proline symporter [Catenulispora sp. GAS73]|uniref:hypothetical protein n=1 Tax=Catenulispora sp. GAS73 TaxID=3156269 RepID=UPI0035142296
MIVGVVATPSGWRSAGWGRRMARLWTSKATKPTPRQARWMGWGFAVAALLTTAGLGWLAAAYSHQRSELAAFKAAPICAAYVQPATSVPCRPVQRATVLHSAHHGGGKGGGYTEVDLLTGPGELVKARIVGASPPPDGEAVTIAWWHGQPAVIQPATRGGAPISTEEGPQWGVPNDATGILVLMAFILGFGAIAWGFLTYYTMSRRRALPVHVVAALSFAVVVILRIRDDYGALSTTAYVVPPLFLVAAIGWLLTVRRSPATRAATGSRRRGAP